MSKERRPSIDDAAGVDALWRIIEDDPVFAPYLPGATGSKTIAAVKSGKGGEGLGLMRNESAKGFRVTLDLVSQRL